MAEVSYGMDHAALLVWIDDNARSERELTGRLCRRHADALVVPRGWTIDDRRDPIPRLFRSIAEDVSAGRTRPRLRSEPRERNTRADSPSLFEGGAVDEPDSTAGSDHDGHPTVHVVSLEPAPEPEVVPVEAESGLDKESITGVSELEYEPIEDVPADVEDVVNDDEFLDEAPIEDDVEVDVDETDPDATQAMPWTPQLTGRYSPDDTGPVSGRLLGRAFGVRKDDE